jgi:hypothetical protein
MIQIRDIKQKQLTGRPVAGLFLCAYVPAAITVVRTYMARRKEAVP